MLFEKKYGELNNYSIKKRQDIVNSLLDREHLDLKNLKFVRLSFVEFSSVLQLISRCPNLKELYLQSDSVNYKLRS